MENYTYEDMTFTGELPQGQRAIVLFREVAALSKQLGAFELHSPADVAYTVSALAGLPSARALAISTLTGWALDGKPITPENFDELFARKGRWLVPYTITFRVWRESGFFGD